MGEVRPNIIEMYEASTGNVPFEKWLSELRDERARGRIRIRLDRLKLRNAGDTFPVGDGISELRIDYGPGYRVYYARSGRNTMLLLCGGDKSTQGADIKNAKEYWAEYQKRT